MITLRRGTIKNFPPHHHHWVYLSFNCKRSIEKLKLPGLHLRASTRVLENFQIKSHPHHDWDQSPIIIMIIVRNQLWAASPLCLSPPPPFQRDSPSPSRRSSPSSKRSPCSIIPWSSHQDHLPHHLQCLDPTSSPSFSFFPSLRHPMPLHWSRGTLYNLHKCIIWYIIYDHHNTYKSSAPALFYQCFQALNGRL